MNRIGVAFNHVVELVLPIPSLLPITALRVVCGALYIAFQLTIIVSGNLSFLNHLTIVPALYFFDDLQLRWIVPRSMWKRRNDALVPRRARSLVSRLLGAVRTLINVLFFALVLYLSIGPVLNMMSPGQAMNRSFDPLRLVNTYGAFGSIGRVRALLVA